MRVLLSLSLSAGGPGGGQGRSGGIGVSMDLRKQVAAAAPAMAQMGGRLAKGGSVKRGLSDQYEQFKRVGYPPEKALKMARNVVGRS